VCGVAFERPAHQISVYSTDTASLANDGLFASTCARSNVETNPWWVVDLGVVMHVTKVTLTSSLMSGKWRRSSA